MPRTSGIYVIENATTHDVYVGSSNDVDKRWKTHFRELSKGTHHSIFLQRAYNKYGRDAFTSFVIEHVVPERTALIEREQYWIEVIHPTYNMNPLATNNAGIPATPETRAHLLKYASMPHTEESKRNQSEGMKRAWANKTEEERQAFSEKASLRGISESTRQGARKAQLGKKQSEETIEKRMKNMRGRVVSEETRANMSQGIKEAWANKSEEERQDFSQKARNRPPISEETRRSMSEAKKGRKLSPDEIAKRTATVTGSKRSEETKARMREAQKLAAQNRDPEVERQKIAKMVEARQRKRQEAKLQSQQQATPHIVEATSIIPITDAQQLSWLDEQSA